jgi:hypothetical protein
MMNRDIKLLQWFAIGFIVVAGLIHLYTTPGELNEDLYLGLLFIANCVGAVVAAYGILRGRRWGWVLGFLVAVGSIGGYVWSRTSGLPGMDVEEWLNPAGIASLLVEGLFVIAFGLWLARGYRQPGLHQ